MTDAEVSRHVAARLSGRVEEVPIGYADARKKGLRLRCYTPETVEEMVQHCGSHSHIWIRDMSGMAFKVKVNGRIKIRKTRPLDVRIPIKYGLRECSYLYGNDLHLFLIPVEEGE